MKLILWSLIGIFIGASASQAASFEAGINGSGTEYHCYSLTADGTLFGPPQMDSICHETYKVACADINDVATSVCYLPANNQCFNADKNGTAYGDAVNPSYCNP